VDVLEQQKKVLGNEHPDTIRAAVDLAVTYGKLGRWEEDVPLLTPAVQHSPKVLGQQHPNAQGDLRGLAFVYTKLGKGKEAQETRDLLIFQLKIVHEILYHTSRGSDIMRHSIISLILRI
jgi:hypothetical protein